MSLEKLNLISIDDNEDNLYLIESYCENLGINIISFSDPVEAMMHVVQNKVDLIVIDYMMPKLNGIEFIQEYRQQDKNVPIVMVTAAGSDDELHLKALEVGVTDFISKPIDALKFNVKIRNLIQLRTNQLLLSDRAKDLEHEVEKATNQVREREFESLETLGRTAEYKDPETAAHVSRVSHYSKLLALKYGLDEEKQDLIFHAAPFHDIGKVGIPDKILLKPGKLDDDEFKIMKQHSEIGHEILKNTKSKYLMTGAVIAISHHEKFDGSGYPNGLKGEDIPIEGRIIAVADVFDALTSFRPYKKPWSFDDAMNFLQEQSSKHFDPKIVELFHSSNAEVRKIFDSCQETNETNIDIKKFL